MAKTPQQGSLTELRGFAHALGSIVDIATEDGPRTGRLVARTEFEDGEPMYSVLYREPVDRRPISQWIAESAIAEHVPPAATAGSASTDARTPVTA